jgi:hypothetical protein
VNKLPHQDIEIAYEKAFDMPLLSKAKRLLKLGLSFFLALQSVRRCLIEAES